MTATAVLRILAVAPAVLLGAQTFPPEFRTGDAAVISALNAFLGRIPEEGHGLSTDFPRLISLPASRVYRQMDLQARVLALQTALPLVKTVAMSDAVRKRIDSSIAMQYGAVDHGLRLPRRPDPQKRMKELQARMQKNPGLMRNPAFLQEMEAVRKQFMEVSAVAPLDGFLPYFTLPLPEVKQKFAQDRQTYGRSGAAKKCYDDSAAFADSESERFRLAAYRCAAAGMGKEMTEAEADRLRKERAQRLYDEKNAAAVIQSVLEEFLAEAATVDFSAQTASQRGRIVFVNPEYEKKDPLWKLIYRNGKEPTETVVAFARVWLAELRPPAAETTSQVPAARPPSAAPRPVSRAPGKR